MSQSSLILSPRSGQERELLYELIEKQRYGVEYQPLICTRSGEILAYEALARFFTSDGQLLSPITVFDLLHDEIPLLSKVELDLKKLQIDYAPSHYDLFLNVDPHAIEDISDLHYDLLLQQLVNQPNIVVELIENSDIHDARAAMKLHKRLKVNGTKTALDDIGADHALLSLEILSLVDYMKFDRSWPDKLCVQRYSLLFKSLLGYASLTGKKTVLEGIETKEMLAIACDSGIDLVQGFLYRPLFHSVNP